MMSLEALIEGHTFFKGLDVEKVSKIAQFASERVFEQDEVIFRQGAEIHQLYLILNGRVALEAYSHHNKMITIQTIGGHEVLGWSWYFPPYHSHFNARAVEKTNAIAIDAKKLRVLIEKDKEFGNEIEKRILPIVVHRLEATMLQLLDVVF